MGCSSSLYSRNEASVFFNLNSNFTVDSFPDETKNILTESWKLVEPLKIVAGKKMFQRLFETHPEVLDMFHPFKGLTQEEIMISPSFHLHVKIVMRSLENAVLSLNDAEKFTQYLMNLGERHERWSINMEHFDLLKEALLWTLQDMLQSTCTLEVSNAWSEMVDSIATTMMYRMKSRNHVISCC